MRAIGQRRKPTEANGQRRNKSLAADWLSSPPPFRPLPLFAPFGELAGCSLPAEEEELAGGSFNERGLQSRNWRW